jgi:protein O-mannosyl-transferase
MITTDNRGQKLTISIFLTVIVLVSYWGVQGNDFINYDDPAYVVENRHVRDGLTWGGFLWAFTTSCVSNWHPLTWLSLMLDHDLFGMNAGGYHWTSVILHWFAGLALFYALGRMTGRLWCSGLVAGLFLVHPLHVESVAWVAERKDVLSGLFWMLGMWGYARYAERRSWDRYAWVMLFFILGLLSKPMVVTFPFVMLLMDLWPLGRMDSRKAIMPLVREKIPFFVLSAAGSAITFWVQNDWNAVAPLSLMPLSERLITIPIAYVTYLKMTFWPFSLSAFYPYHGIPEWWKVIPATLFLLIITLLAFSRKKSYPYLLVGWLWYLGTLVPVIGLVKVGSQAMADRYTYLPLVGIFMILSFGGADWIRDFRQRKAVLWIMVIPIFAFLMALTILRVEKWRDSKTLFTDAIAHTEENYQAHYLLGMAKVQEQEITKAMNHYREAIRIRPMFVQAHNSLGHLLMIQGRYGEALSQFEETLRIRSDFAPAIKNMGDLRLRQGKTDEAIDCYRRAILYEMEDAELFNNYGVALFMKGERENAIGNIREALRLKPDYREAKENLRKILHQRQGG